MEMPDLALLTGALQGLLFWVFLLLLILGLALGPRYLRSRDRQKLYDLMRTAYEKGQPVPPELIASLTAETPEPAPRSSSQNSDLRRAVVLIAVGLGLAGLGLGLGWGISTASDVGGSVTGGIIAGVGAIPGFIGLAYLFLWLVGRGGPRT
jgi:hypothetical protein